MLLYNTLSAPQRARLIEEAGEERITLSFYKYYRIEDPAGLRDRLFVDWTQFDVLGRIYVASEGINAQLSLPAGKLQAFSEYLDATGDLKGVRLNIAVKQDNKSFLKLKIKVRDRIVADGIDDAKFDASKVGVHLQAKQFNELVSQPDTLLVDMRNRFESEIGYFKGALRPDTETFRDSLGTVEPELKAHGDQKNIVMYCTGGIRCEKASAWFLHRGFKNVFQLDGGIIEYHRQVKSQGLENLFMGKNFVFDFRMAERISEHVVSLCHQCDAPSDHHQNCNNTSCNLLLIQCPACSELMNGCCSEACKSFVALPLEQQKALRKGVKASQRYSRRK